MCLCVFAGFIIEAMEEVCVRVCVCVCVCVCLLLVAPYIWDGG